jgi:hypothetical protein
MHVHTCTWPDYIRTDGAGVSPCAAETADARSCTRLEVSRTSSKSSADTEMTCPWSVSDVGIARRSGMQQNMHGD